MLKKIIVFLLLPIHFSISQAPKTYTSSEILLQLKKLNTVGSILYIAAHPDDENTRLITYLANEKCLRTGYLSLTRGDGGQNLIGPEQGVELGLIRTQELLAARRIDGGEQFFTRAYDFGYSKTHDETLETWNKDSILSDIVWVIRNFKPDIIITRFASDGSGGHGHHTASAILGEEAFDAAADSTRFKDQLRYTKTWKARRLFQNSTARFRNPNADMSKFLKLDVGVFNSLLGKSYGEIAAESRSMHKSQGFGSSRQRGEYLEYFRSLKGDTANLKSIFDGIDFSWKRIREGDSVGILCDQAIKNFNLNKPDEIAPYLIKIFELQNFSQLLSQNPSKFMMARNLISSVCGIFIDITCNEAQISTGLGNKITVTMINRSNQEINIEKLYIPGPLKDAFLHWDTLLNIKLIPNQIFSFTTYLNVKFLKEDKKWSQPYWLESLPNGIFHTKDQNIIGFAELDFNTNCRVFYTVNDKLSVMNVPIQYRWVDPEKGELYRPLVITPPVLVSMENEVFVFPNNTPKEIKVKIKAAIDGMNATVKLQLNGEWRIEPSSIQVSLLKKNEEKTVVFKVNPTALSAETYVKAIAEVNGDSYNKSISEIKYDHIPVQTWFTDAQAKLLRLEIKKSARTIGYIPGAGDEVLKYLLQLGYEVTNITDDMLSTEHLNKYSTIITGVRAYNTNPLLTKYNSKLLDFVKNGGNLIVQYNTNSFSGPFKGDIGPKPFKITRDRVTDENAKVSFLLPKHPVLNIPNKLTEKDFEGWIQERGIYFAGEIDSTYDCPLGMGDKGEEAKNGSLIIGKHGKGNFIYTGLVFFRQLPAGVPGAYRLFHNLIELGKT